MKKLGIGLLIFSALCLEINFVKIWLLPYMDYSLIGFVYITALLCRLLLYSLIIGWYDIMWDKYITNNTQAYRDGLIKLYQEQKDSEYGFMFGVLKIAIRELESGKNPTSIENWVVKMEKKLRGKI